MNTRHHDCTTLAGSKYAWWSGNARFVSLSGKFIGAHIAHSALILFWTGSTTLFELSHYTREKPLFEQGFILIPHLTSLAYSTSTGGEITDVYLIFIIGILHLITFRGRIIGRCSPLSIFGPELTEVSPYGFIFSYRRNILHLHTYSIS